MNNSKSCVVQNHKIDLLSWSHGSEVYQKSDLDCRIYQDWSEELQSTIATRKRENLVNTAQKMASKSSTKQDEEATTEKVPGSIAIHPGKKK